MPILDELEQLVKGLDPKKRAELVAVAGSRLKQMWLPNPGPQTEAYLSKADLLLYGGAAGGGKSDLLLGLATTQHLKSVIFRRAYRDLADMERRLLDINGGRDGYNGSDMVWNRNNRLLEFGALEKPGSEFSWQGRRHDFKGFDEGAQIPAEKMEFVLGWLATTVPGQRSRAVIASNPPIAGEGDYLIEWFAPWLDPLYDNPAAPGELRWAISVNSKTVWVGGPGEYKPDAALYEPGEWQQGMVRYTALSRTFIPALLDDNPFLKHTDYRSKIENMREPLRSQLLYGDFLAGREDHEWQIFPTAWIHAAQARWAAAPLRRRTMIALATDVALGGKDNVSTARLHEDNWFDELVVSPGIKTDDPADIAATMMRLQRDGADLSVDATGGWGSGVKSNLALQHKLDCFGHVFSQGSTARALDGRHTFLNKRAEMYWRFYEALSPDSGENVMLPSMDKTLLAELTSLRYFVRGTDIVVESKEEVRKRLKTSTDRADAVVMAWARRNVAVSRKVARGQVPGLPPVPRNYDMPVHARESWMVR